MVAAHWSALSPKLICLEVTLLPYALFPAYCGGMRSLSDTQAATKEALRS